MAKFRKLTSNKLAGGQITSKALKPADLVMQVQATVRPTTRVSAATDLKRLSNGSLPTLKGIQFGSPSNAGSKSRSSTGDEWTNLVKTASGGAASLIGGSFLGSGVNSLISGLTNLFDGGAKSEKPLVRFTLPEPQQQTMYITSGGLSASDNFQEASQNTSSPGPVYKQSEIVKAVKNALLTSSSLNDVIAEI
ncbi:MAG: hypothetical protein JO150_13430 [Acidobacteriaceae bacterium]|nr:hypothetical protein [Acidobacteriaceae bacterium]